MGCIAVQSENFDSKASPEKEQEIVDKLDAGYLKYLNNFDACEYYERIELESSIIRVGCN